MSTGTMISLKGSEFYGEFYPKASPEWMVGYLYRLADRRFALVKKEDYSGKVLSVEPIDGTKVRRFGSMNLGYSVVSYYTWKS